MSVVDEKHEQKSVCQVSHKLADALDEVGRIRLTRLTSKGG